MLTRPGGHLLPREEGRPPPPSPPLLVAGAGRRPGGWRVTPASRDSPPAPAGGPRPGWTTSSRTAMPVFSTDLTTHRPGRRSLDESPEKVVVGVVLSPCQHMFHSMWSRGSGSRLRGYNFMYFSMEGYQSQNGVIGAIMLCYIVMRYPSVK